MAFKMKYGKASFPFKQSEKFGKLVPVKQEIDYHEKYLRDEANIFSKQKKEVMPNGKIL